MTWNPPLVITGGKLDKNAAWTRETFGPGDRLAGLLDHMRKELEEIARDPSDLTEWIDVILLALDGAARQGYSGREVIEAFHRKVEKNKNRTWPDWRDADPSKAIEHVRTPDD